MNQQIAYLSQLKQTMELYQFMVKLCWLKTLLDAQVDEHGRSTAASAGSTGVVKEKRTSGFEKIETDPHQAKSTCKSLSRQEKSEVSTIATSEVIKGRMYDFNNGRFLSVDPYIQGVTSQAINPYSYIQNNPLSGTDPTGYVIESGCDDTGSCELEFESNEVDSVSLNDDGSVTVNTTGGESYTVTDANLSIQSNGKDVNVSISALNGLSGSVSDIGSQATHRLNISITGSKQDKTGQQLTSLALDVAPVVGSGKSFLQVFTGEDLVTGQKLDRLEEAGGIILGLFGAKGLTKIDEAADLAQSFSKKSPAKSARGPDTPHPDGTGRLHHYDMQQEIPKNWKSGQLDDAIDAMQRSIKQRKLEIQQHGNNSRLGGHHERLRREEDYLKRLVKRRSQVSE